jgi:hypothetical protein
MPTTTRGKAQRLPISSEVAMISVLNPMRYSTETGGRPRKYYGFELYSAADTRLKERQLCC